MRSADHISSTGRLHAGEAVRVSRWASVRRLSTALLIPILLILTQQAAFVHELGHFAQQVQRSDDPERQTTGGDFCEKCFAFAHLSAASPIAPISFLPSLPDAECPGTRLTAGYSAESSSCRIRGPPAIL